MWGLPFVKVFMQPILAYLPCPLKNYFIMFYWQVNLNGKNTLIKPG